MIYSSDQDLFLLKIYFDDSAYNKTFLGYGRNYQMQRRIRNPSLNYISNMQKNKTDEQNQGVFCDYLVDLMGQWTQ